MTDLTSSEDSKAKERLHLFMEASFDGLWDWKIKTGETYVSPSYYQMLGYEPSDLAANVDALFIGLLHPDDREPTLSLVHKQLSSTGHYDIELRMRCHDGTYKWINSRGKLVERDAQGAPSRAIGTHTDITERKLHELNLIESERRFKEIADCAPVMIWISGLDKLCYFFNKTWLDFTGRTLEEEAGHGWAEGVHPDDFDNCLKIYLESFDAQRPFSMNYRLRRHDGEFRWIQDAGIPRFNEEGQFLGYMGSCVDISERKQAEDYFRIIVDASPYAMLLLNDQGTIDLVNRELTTLFGYSSKELVGQFIETLVPKEIAKDHVQFRKAYLAQPTACSIGKERIVMGRRKNGSMFQAEIGLSPFHIGHRQYVISVIIDVTERKKAEQAVIDLNASLEQKVKDRTYALEKASFAKTDFLARMSHEIRNPINTINLSSYMLTREPLTEEQQNVVDRIVRSSKSLLAIVNEILDFSKIEAGQIDLDELPVNLTELLKNISDTQRMMATEKGLHFHAEIPEDLLSRVLCDAIRIEQILNNLISNAIKFTSEGDVWLRVQVTREDQGEVSVYFEVADTGIGIPSEIIPRLGSPFTQADRTVSRQFGGTGLGLSIAKKLIQLMKGDLEIQSTQGSGSVFSFALTFLRAKKADS